MYLRRSKQQGVVTKAEVYSAFRAFLPFIMLVTVATIITFTLYMIGFPIIYGALLILVTAVMYIISEKLISPRYPELKTAFWVLWLGVFLLLLGLYQIGVLPPISLGLLGEVPIKQVVYISVIEAVVLATLLASTGILFYIAWRMRKK